MWDNLVFWRIAALVTSAFLIAITIFFYQRVKKIKKDYDESFDKAQNEVTRLEGEESRVNGKLQTSISTLIDLLVILNNWARTKEPSNKLEFQETLEKLPREIRELIKIEF